MPKHRRQDIQPLPLHLVSDLKKHLANKLPLTPAFNVPGRTDFSRMFRADLNAARKAWIEQTDAVEDRAGREQFQRVAKSPVEQTTPPVTIQNPQKKQAV
jgi:hypothetical protein